jgi:hypothetical protein
MNNKPVKINYKTMSNEIFKKEFSFTCKVIITIILNIPQSVGNRFKMSNNIEK